MTDRRKLIPPRRCRKVASGDGEYCEVHGRQRELQDVYRRLEELGFSEQAAKNMKKLLEDDGLSRRPLLRRALEQRLEVLTPSVQGR